jgi:S-adenosylmethionine:tRNA ribosyltransferase-isomerase
LTLDDFDFALPEDRIAVRPARPRDAARLLHVPETGAVEDRTVRDLPDLLRAGDVLVFNDTRVIPAALQALRPARDPAGRDVTVSLNLHRRVAAAHWRVFARPARRLSVGDTLVFADGGSARITQKAAGGEFELAFDRAGDVLDAWIERVGRMPLPPYIASRRAVDDADAEDYQTVYSARTGSVAAPTAGLHFTARLLEALDARGVERVHVTLHVGAGTFLPVTAADVSSHRMHAEWYEVLPGAARQLQTARREGRRIIAVGTTSLRTLESAADADGMVMAGSADTAIFITPGHRWRVVDGLWTNFHLPRSTLFMLVSALAGRERMQAAYAHAIERGYRFYSYGDASLLWRTAPSAA